MKAYTDLEQSKKLAEILPLESSDMCWQQIYDENHMMSDYRLDLLPYRFNSGISIPAWSLATLFSVLPKSACLEKGSSTELCRVNLPIELISSDWNLEPVDACYEMVLKLHEQKLL